jgi:hypothetical protein
VINIRQVPDGIRDPYWAGTLTIRSVDVWKAIVNSPRFRLRLPDGREGTFDAPDGAGMLPPSEARPTTFRIARTDDGPF